MSTFQVDPVTSLQNATYTPSASADTQLDKLDFMKLIVAQLRNQNPLAPQSDTDFMAQLAQFEALNQMQLVAQGIKAMQGLSELSSAAALIGKEVVGRTSAGVEVVRDIVARELFGLPYGDLAGPQRQAVDADARVKEAAASSATAGTEISGVVERVVVGPDGVPVLVIGNHVVDLFSVVEVR